VNPKLALGRLYQLQTYSMPRFVLGASPFVTPGDGQLLDVLRQVTVQQEHMASQLAEVILLRGGSLPKGTYPMRYASLHDLELRYLLARIFEEQRVVVRVVEELARALREDKSAQRLAQEVRRNETAHLRLLGELSLRFPTADGHRRDKAHAADELVGRGSQPSRSGAMIVNADSGAQTAPWSLAS
jgi:hypothetical protein